MSRKLFRRTIGFVSREASWSRNYTDSSGLPSEKRNEDARKACSSESQGAILCPEQQLIELCLAPCFSDRAARLTYSFAPSHLYCAISHATGRASSPSQSLQPRASCQAKSNPMGPPSTSHNGLHSTSLGCPKSPVEHFHHECQFGKKRWYLTVSVNGLLTSFRNKRIPGRG